jgi:uncharacterized membrane protein
LPSAYNLDSKTGKIFAIPSDSKKETLEGVRNLLTAWTVLHLSLGLMSYTLSTELLGFDNY